MASTHALRRAVLLAAVATSAATVQPRRAVLRSAIAAAAVTALPPPSFAFFESKEQQALTSLATAQPKLKGLIKEVNEVKRKRVRMSADSEDDAYVFRFARSVLDPVTREMAVAAPGIATERAAALPAEFAKSIEALNTACRAKSAEGEVDALVAADNALTELLDLAKGQKFDTKPGNDDINGYDSLTGVIYNPFLFRAG